MSDPMNLVPLLQGITAAVLTSAAVFFVAWRFGKPLFVSASAVIAVGLGMGVGVYLLGPRLHWPPEEDQERLLFILYPAVIAVELLGCFPRTRWLAWLLRLGLAANAAPVLLHGSVYLTQEPGPDSLGWTPAQKWLLLGVLAAALAGVWSALNLLAERRPGRSVPLALACACAAAAVAVMLTGYASAGPFGILLAVALVGTTAAALTMPTPADIRGALGIGVIGLFSLVVVGRFFGELSTAGAALLFLAPLLCWVPELPYVERMGPRLRGVVRVMLTAVPLAFALFLAHHGPVRPTNEDNPEGSAEDYMNFGK